MQWTGRCTHTCGARCCRRRWMDVSRKLSYLHCYNTNLIHPATALRSVNSREADATCWVSPLSIASPAHSEVGIPGHTHLSWTLPRIVQLLTCTYDHATLGSCTLFLFPWRQSITVADETGRWRRGRLWGVVFCSGGKAQEEVSDLLSLAWPPRPSRSTPVILPELRWRLSSS